MHADGEQPRTHAEAIMPIAAELAAGYVLDPRRKSHDPFREVAMRVTAFVSCAVLVVACARTEEKPTDSAAAQPAAAPAPAPAPAISLASLAGKWTQVARAENSDSVLVTAEVTATADPAGWTLKLPGRPVVPLRVTVDGDSIITGSGPYESVLRKGVQVTTDGVVRLKDGKLVGTTVAHYKSAGADSVVRLRIEMTRAQ